MTAYRLDLPPSTNDLLRPAFMGDPRCPFCNNRPPKRPLVRFVATGEAKDFRAHAHRRLPVEPVSGAVEVFCTFFVSTLSTDVDNRIKSLLDAMKGRLLWDDVQVAELHVVKVITDDENKHGVVVEVRPADPAEHPELSKRLAKSSIAEKDTARRQGALGLTSTETPKTGSVPKATLPEELQQKLNRLVRPAVISNRPKPDDEGPKGAT